MKRKEEERKKMQDEYERKLREADLLKKKAQEEMEKLLKEREAEHLRELERMKQELQNSKANAAAAAASAPPEPPPASESKGSDIVYLVNGFGATFTHWDGSLVTYSCS